MPSSSPAPNEQQVIELIDNRNFFERHPFIVAEIFFTLIGVILAFTAGPFVAAAGAYLISALGFSGVGATTVGMSAILLGGALLSPALYAVKKLSELDWDKVLVLTALCICVSVACAVTGGVGIGIGILVGLTPLLPKASRWLGDRVCDLWDRIASRLGLKMTRLSKAAENDYSLYLLSDNNPEALKQAEKQIGNNNAILLYPDVNPPDSKGFRQYFANIFQNRKSIAIKPMGRRNFTSNPPDVKNLTNVALAKAGICTAVAPSLKAIAPVFPTAVAPTLDNPSLVSFASTSFFANHLADPVFQQQLLRKLINYISEGNKDKVKEMLKDDPRLALVTWKARYEDKKIIPNAEEKETYDAEKIIINKGGQLIDVAGKTAYEFALGEEDDEIADLLRKSIVTLKGEDHANDLFDAQFPDGWEQKEKEKWQPIIDLLNNLPEIVRNSMSDINRGSYPDYKLTITPDSTIAKTLNNLQTLLQKRLNDPVSKGRHYNPDPLLRTFQLYDARHFGYDWSDNMRARLCWQLVWYLQRHMPANYVQAFCKPGLYGNVKKIKKSEPQERSFRVQTEDNVTRKRVADDFYPRSGHPLGDELTINSYARREDIWRFGTSLMFANLLSIKASYRTKHMLHHGRRDVPAKMSMP